MSKTGFTLMEILISILVLGFSISGLLNFLKWGQTSYLVIAATCHKNLILNDLRDTLRAEIAKGTDMTSSLPKSLVDRIPKGGRFRLARLESKPYGSGAVFVTAVFYEDRNRNGMADQGEERFNRLWCFRKRVEA